jgi:sugar/nucleoside kinase (ribokinase family)
VPGRSVVLCAGIAVEDFIFRVEAFPTPSTKAPARDLVVTGGGCAANAAVTVARLGGDARFAGPLGGDEASERIVQGLRREGVDTTAIVRLPNAVASVSGIFIDASGERLLATRHAQGLETARPAKPEHLVRDIGVLLVDNRFPEFVLPICRAARDRRIPIVLDVDRPTHPADPLLAVASHSIFSAEALRATSVADDLEAALRQAAERCGGFVAVTDGANGVLWRDGGRAARLPAFAVETVDTLAAGDVFHGAFALALAEGRSEIVGLRFAAAAAAIKCTRFGGITGAPSRAETEWLLQRRDDR